MAVPLSYKDGFVAKGSLRNLSEGGVKLRISNLEAKTKNGKKSKFDIGDPIKMTLESGELSSSTLELEGRIVHLTVNSHTSIGIKFRHLSSKDLEVIRNYVD